MILEDYSIPGVPTPTPNTRQNSNQNGTPNTFTPVVTTPGNDANQAILQQMNAMMAITISAAIDRIFDRMDQRRTQPNEPGSVQGSSVAATITPSASKLDRFRAKEVSLFDPNPNVFLIESKGDGNIYHNVFSFTVRLRV